MLDNLNEKSKAAEGAVLASMILDRNEVDTVRGILRPDDFGATEHRILFEGIVALAEAGPGEICLVRMRDWLSSRDQLDAVGGVEYLVKVADSVPTSANAEHYGRIVKEHSTRRQLAGIAQGLLSRCLLPDGADAEQIRAEAVKDLTEVDGTPGQGPTTLADALDGIDLTDGTLYVPTGFNCLDTAITGLGRGHLLIVAGRPGMGKSALMAEIALRTAEAGKQVLFFSLEMSAADLGLRMICSRAGLDTQKAAKGYLSMDERDLFDRVRENLRTLPIQFDCKSLTPARLKSVVLSAKRRGECDVVFVDYLGLMRADTLARSRYESTTEISNDLKRLALDADLPVVVGCQLNRMNEGRNDKRPTLSDLRDSGSIEQDADVVLLLHRPHYYDHTQPTELCECHVSKNRRGPTRTIELGFTEIYTRFYDTLEQGV